MKNTLSKILELEAKIAKLGVEKDELGKTYITEKFNYRKGDKVTIIFKDNNSIGIDNLSCEINTILFDSHCYMMGLCIKLIVTPINKLGVKIPNRNGILIDRDVIYITPHKQLKV